MRGIPLILVLLACQSEQRSTPQDDHYVAAVVEYQVSSNVEQNRLNYIASIAEAVQQGADIVVFPELTLTNGSVSFQVPIYGALREYPIPALYPQLYDNLLVSMSQAARENQVYLVINTREHVDCVANNTGEECPEAIQYYFNTNVVFDREGRVIDRYRKINLFGERSHTPALHPDLGVFSTDFGVTFGHFICFDLMFQVPAIQLVQKTNITDVIFTTMWFSEMPYLTAVQIQESYAYSLNVNFLAAGANNVRVGSAGSGIYSGHAGALISIMPGLPTTRVLVARVPKVPGRVTGTYPGPIYDSPSDHDSLTLIRDPSLPSQVSRQLVNGFQEFTLVDKDVSCTFRVNLNLRNTTQDIHFRAAVKDGTNVYSRRHLGVALCLVVACKDDDFKSCPYKYDPKETPTEIEELSITMRTYGHQFNSTLACDNVMYFPVSFKTDKFPIEPVNTTFMDSNTHIHLLHKEFDVQNEVSYIHDGIFYNRNGGRDNVRFKIRTPQNNLVAFGIWGRLYAKDVDHSKEEVPENDKTSSNTILDRIYSL